MTWFKKSIGKIKDECLLINEEMSAYTACSTGYRPQKCPWGFNEQDIRCLDMRKRTKAKVENAIQNGYKVFISGMAIGFDMIFAEIVLELKEKYPQIKLVAALPYRDQYRLWKENQIARYKNLLQQCDDVRCLYERYDDNPKCMLERNDYMLNCSSLVFALFDNKPGGTKYTVNKAKQKGLKIELIKP